MKFDNLEIIMLMVMLKEHDILMSLHLPLLPSVLSKEPYIDITRIGVFGQVRPPASQHLTVRMSHS